MGQQQAKQRERITESYTIVKTLSPGEYWIRRKKKSQQLLLRVLTFHLQEEASDFVRLLDRRKKIHNPHLLELVEHNRLVEQRMCSQTFKIRTIIEYPFRSIAEDIKERAAATPHRWFSEDELWSILYSCCHALFALYANKISHEALSCGQICIDTAGIIKLADPILVPLSKNYLALMSDEPESRYVSPELISLVEENNFYYYDKEKSDVYVLGMLAVEIGNLREIPFYERVGKRFELAAVERELEGMKGRYSQRLVEVVERMLVQEAKNRPRFDEIIESIEQKTVQTSSSLTSREQSEVGFALASREKVRAQTEVKEAVLQAKPQAAAPILRSTMPNTVYPPMSNPPFQINAQSNYQPLPAPTYPPMSFPKFNPAVVSTPIENLYSHAQTFKYNEHPTERPSIPAFPAFTDVPKLDTWKFDSVLREIRKEGEMGYTPYANIANYSNNTSQPSQQQFLKRQTHVLPPLPPAPPQPLKERRFSECKFGGIQLDTTKQQPPATPAIPQEDLTNPITKKLAISSSTSRLLLKQPDEEPAQKGSFVIEETENGRYEGFKFNGCKQGVGRIEYWDGGFYQGQWNNDRMQGYGKLYYPDGKIAYEGYWQDNEFSGTGRVYNDQPETEGQPVDWRDFGTVGEKWLVYEGEFSRDSRHGRGAMKFVSGEKFVGSFKWEAIEGEGSFHAADGTVVHGIWTNNKLTSTL